MDANHQTVAADNLPATFASGALALSRADHLVQEDTLVAHWNGTAHASLGVMGPAVVVTRQAYGDMALKFDLRVDAAPTAPVLLTACSGACTAWTNISSLIANAGVGGWTSLSLPLSCLRKAGLNAQGVTVPFLIGTSGQFGVSLSAARLVPLNDPAVCPSSRQS
jgi:beta-glucosidase